MRNRYNPAFSRSAACPRTRLRPVNNKAPAYRGYKYRLMSFFELTKGRRIWSESLIKEEMKEMNNLKPRQTHGGWTDRWDDMNLDESLCCCSPHPLLICIAPCADLLHPLFHPFFSSIHPTASHSSMLSSHHSPLIPLTDSVPWGKSSEWDHHGAESGRDPSRIRKQLRTQTQKQKHPRQAHLLTNNLLTFSKYASSFLVGSRKLTVCLM